MGVIRDPSLTNIKITRKTRGKPCKNKVVPKAGLEPARLAAGDFESPASTIPPLGRTAGRLAKARARVQPQRGTDVLFVGRSGATRQSIEPKGAPGRIRP